MDEEDGEVVQVSKPDTDAIALYNSMREVRVSTRFVCNVVFVYCSVMLCYVETRHV